MLIAPTLLVSLLAPLTPPHLDDRAYADLVDELWCAAAVPLCTLVFETPEETVEVDVHYEVGQWVPWVGPRPNLTFELVEFSEG